MKKTLLTIVIVGVMVGGMAYINARISPDRLTEARAKDSQDVEEKLDEFEEKQEEESTKLAQTESDGNADAKESAVTPEDVPDEFNVKFECSNGTFVVEVNKKWAPLGAARFYELVKKDVYDGARFFRVVPGFVVQFGIPGDPEEAAKWRNNTIKDDPVKKSNRQGTIVFATSGKDSRTSQVFINLEDNARLDGMGFAPFGEVIKGFEVVKEINSEYGQQPNQGQIQTRGNEYLNAEFPNLDYIKKATIVEKDEDDAKKDEAAKDESGKEEREVLKPEE